MRRRRLVDAASNSLPDGVSINYLLMDKGCNDGQMVFNMSTLHELLAAIDQELANCRYVERLDMSGVDIHIINLMGVQQFDPVSEFWVGE
jgi:hypothetical protein